MGDDIFDQLAAQQQTPAVPLNNTSSTPTASAPGSGDTDTPSVDQSSGNQSAASGDVFDQLSYKAPPPAPTPTPPPTPEPQPGFWSRASDNSGATGIKDIGEAQVKHTVVRPIDLYHEMISNYKNGDMMAATDTAQKLVQNLTMFGMADSSSPLMQAAKTIIMHPIDEFKKQQEENRKAALEGRPNAFVDTWNDAKKDYNAGNTAGAIADVVTTPFRSHAAGVVPVLGPAMQSTAEDVNTDMHNHNWMGLAGDVAGTAAGFLGGKAFEGAGEAGATRAGRAEAAADHAATLHEVSNAADSRDAISKSVGQKMAVEKARINNDFANIKTGAETGHEAATTAAESAHDTATTTAGAQQAADEAAAKAGHDTTVQQAGNEADTARQSAEAEQAKTKTGLDIDKQDTENRLRASKEDQTADLGEQKTTDQQAVQDALDTSNKGTAKTFADTLAQAGEGAASSEEQAKSLSKGLTAADKAASARYEAGMTGDQGIITQLGDSTIPVVGNSLSKMADARRVVPKPGTHSIANKMGEIAGDGMNPKILEQLKEMATGTEQVKDSKGKVMVDDDGNEQRRKIDPYNAQALVDIRQNARKAMEGTTRGDTDWKALNDIMHAATDTIGELAEKSGKPGVVKQYAGMRDQYRLDRSRLDSDVAEKLNFTQPDKILSDTNKYLLGGESPGAKLDTIGPLVGEDQMYSLAKTYVSELGEKARTDPEGAINDIDKLARIKGDVKKKFLGQLEPVVDEARRVYDQSMQHAQDTAEDRLAGVSKAHRDAKIDLRRQIEFQKQTSSAEYKANIADNNTKAAAAIQAAKDHLDGIEATSQASRDAAIEASKQAKTSAVSAADTAKEQALKAADTAKKQTLADATTTRDEALAPFSRGFINTLSKGDVMDKLFNGDVDTNDIIGVKKVIGEPAWREVAKQVWNRGIAEAGGDPGKIVEWWKKFPSDEVRNEFFSLNDPVVGNSYKSMMAQIEKTAEYQSLAKVGLGAGTAGVGAAVLGSLAAGGVGLLLGGGAMHVLGETLGGLMAALAGLNYTPKVPLAKSVIAYVANNPNTWKALKVGAKAGAVASNAAIVAGKAAKYAPIAGRLAPPQEDPNRPLNKPEDYQQAISSASQMYPRLAPYLQNTVIESKQRPANEPADAELETLPPWEDWNPNKGKTTVQIYQPYTDKSKMATALAGDMFHVIGGIDNRTGRPVDPVYYKLKQDVIAARSPVQDELDRRTWKEEEGHGGRSFKDWMQSSRADAYIRGLLTPELEGKYPDEWRKSGTYSTNPRLKTAIMKIDAYLKGGSSGIRGAYQGTNGLAR